MRRGHNYHWCHCCNQTAIFEFHDVYYCYNPICQATLNPNARWNNPSHYFSGLIHLTLDEHEKIIPLSIRDAIKGKSPTEYDGNCPPEDLVN